MKTILILMLSFSQSGGATSTTVEFRNRALCESAKAAVLAQAHDKTNRFVNVIAECVEG